MKIGVLCPSEIALRRFMPALSKCSGLFEFAGVAFANEEEWFSNGYSEESERNRAEEFQKV